jgi:lipopolysaccharide export system permease protein
MRLHDRYLFRELLTPMSYCLGGFMAVWLSFFFFTKLDDMREAKLHALDVLQFCLASLPEFFILVLPILLLLALLYALTHHARHNEITAVRAAGVGLWRLCAPYFIVGLLATGVYFAMNEIAVPRCQQWTLEILTRHIKTEKDPKMATRYTGVGFRNIHARRMWVIGEYDIKTATMFNPNARWPLPDGTMRQLKAARGVHTNGIWTFFNAQIFQERGKNGNPVALFSTNEIAMPEFDETPKQIALEIKFSDAGGLLSSRTANIPLTDLWAYLRQNPDLAGKDAGQLLTKFHSRIAAPWTCLIVVLMAIPFGAQSGRRNLFFGVAGSIFICFGYFVLQQVSLAFGLSGRVPGWVAAWLPNFIFAIVGIILTLRVR